MKKNQEKVLVAALCGMVVVAAGAFAVQPALAGKKPAVSTQHSQLVSTVAFADRDQVVRVY